VTLTEEDFVFDNSISSRSH